MSLPTTSIRTVVKRRLFDLIKEAAPLRLDGSGQVQVLYGPNLRELQDETIWLGAIEGNMEIPVMGGSRVRRNDTFSIDVLCMVRSPNLIDEPDDAQLTADTQAEAMAAVVQEIVAASPGLGSGGEWEDVEGGVLMSGVGEFSGPSPLDLSEAGLGVWAAACVVKVDVQTRLI